MNMSSPSTAGGNNASVAVREGTRVILREITANLQNSPPAQSPRRKSGNEATTIKGEQQQHDVKVRFIREFADAGASGREANTESSLSSASSFQSLTSTLSSKCSSGICVDSSPAKASDTSYLSADIPGLDDLISACENIRLNDKTLDLSKDQSFSLQLDGEDLSGDQTFTSAVDRNSPNRTREISPGTSPVNFQLDVTQDLEVATPVDGDTETSTANAYFECATVDVVEATRYQEANSELDTVDEAFVQCVSSLAQLESAPAACDDPGEGAAAKNQDTHENLEILVENKSNDDLLVGGDERVDEFARNSTLSLDKFTGNSISTLESLSDLIVEGTATQLRDNEEAAPLALDVTVDLPSDFKEIETAEPEQSEVSEKSVQSVLDVTVDLKNDLKETETVALRQSEVAEKPTESVLDVTVDFSSDLKESEIVGSTQIQVAKESVPSILDVTVDLQSDLTEIKTVGLRRSEVVEKPIQSVLDVTVDFPSDPKEIESVGTTRQSEVAEKPTQSVLDVTVNFPSDLKEIDDLQFSDIVDKHPIPVESVPDLVANVSSSESHKFNEESQCPSLPTLSSVCLRNSLTESDAQLVKEPVENVQSAENTIPTVAAPSLSEKFANIAAKDISPGNSISTVKEPTFLNAQKLVDDSIELGEPTAAAESEVAILSGTSNPDHEFVANAENPIQPAQPEFREFKKPEVPVEKVATTVPSPKSPKEETKASKTETLEATNRNIEAVKQINPEILENTGNREPDSSTDSEDLNDTVAIQDISAGNIFAAVESDQYAEFLPPQQSTALTLDRPPAVNLNKFDSVAVAGSISGDNSVSKPVPDDYAAFVPQQQSTALSGFANRPLGKLERQPTPFVTACPPPVEAILNGERNKSPKPALPIDDRCNFEKLELAAKAVANDIYNTSLELEDESGGRFVSATSELFHDPNSFDFLLSKTPRKNTRRDLRAESLYVKFDPLVSNTSMLPQGNIQNASPPANEERNGDNNTTIANIGTPKRSSAIAAIDKLLFYSPMTTTTAPTSNTANIQKTNDSQEKAEPTEETSAETVNMAKELELVRSTVLQLEEQLEKLKIDHDEALEKQSSYQEKINQLQTQLAQEIKNKNQITVVVDEYEKSISRLVAERERDRKNLDLEKAKLQEELAAAKHHLDNTEAAFNDVHLKYERLKAVVSTYKNNEAMLKQSIQENVEIIKSLENRYEQVKEHATARLEKANQDLDAIRKQNESETVRLHAMLRKAELKSNSLAELVEQKTKENKELTQILDEVIARVGRKQSD